MITNNIRMLELENNSLTTDQIILIGSYVNFHRKKKGLSLENVCYILKEKYSIDVSKGRLSKFENGKRPLSESIFIKLLMILDIELYDNDFDESNLSNLIFDALNCFCELETDEEQKIFNDVLECSHYLYSLEFIKYLLIMLMYNIRITKNQEDISILLVQLDKYSHLLNDKDFAIYMIYRGINNYNINKYTNAVSNFDVALKRINNDDNTLKGIIYYYINFIEQSLNHPIIAMRYCNIAISEFSKTSNFTRVLSLKMHLGNCYTRLNQFEEAKQLFLEVLTKMRSLKRVNFKNCIYYNLSGLLLKMENYEEAIKYTRIALSSGLFVEYTLIYIPYSLYRLNRIDEMMTEIEIASKHPNICKMQILFFKALTSKVNSNHNDAIGYLKRYYKLICKQKDIETETFTLRILFQWLSDNRQYEEAVDYATRLIKLTSSH